MKELDVVIFSKDKYLRAALCEEARLMGYTCGFSKDNIGCGGTIVVYDLSMKEELALSGSNIIYIADTDDVTSNLPADSVLFKRPFSMGEFSCALRTLAAKKNVSVVGEPAMVLFDTFILFDGKRIDLTENEMIILRALWNGNGKAVSRQYLEELTDANGDGNMVAVYISRLRTKLEGVTDKKIIFTVRDVGYRLPR